MSFFSKLNEARPAQWLADYLRGRLRHCPPPPGVTRHLLFSIADHWEPSCSGAGPSLAEERTRDWAGLYPRAAAAHCDADGRHPAHSFFYPYDEYRRSELEALSELSADGFSEVELHLHHCDDTSESLRHKLEEAVELYRREGCFGTDRDGRPAFGFVHGDWALDNSRHEHGRNFCGVNDELRVLAEAGCYADFTFPGLGTDAQPSWVNRILRVTDEPARSKSYDRGVEARVGAAPACDLMMVQGPLAIHYAGGRLRIDDSQITGGNPSRPDRVDAWVQANVHVLGRPEWVFVKLHTHGCSERNRLALLTRDLPDLWSDLEARYNDGESWRLHYVTTRETYNIIRAAEDGLRGDPGRYRDYEILPPPCIARHYSTHDLRELEAVR
jgi:hypothetical protein